MTEERKEFEDELSEAEARVSERDEMLRESRVEMDSLRNKIAFLDEQNRELKKRRGGLQADHRSGAALCR